MMQPNLFDLKPEVQGSGSLIGVHVRTVPAWDRQVDGPPALIIDAVPGFRIMGAVFRTPHRAKIKVHLRRDNDPMRYIKHLKEHCEQVHYVRGPESTFAVYGLQRKDLFTEAENDEAKDTTS